MIVPADARSCVIVDVDDCETDRRQLETFLRSEIVDWLMLQAWVHR